MNKKTAPPRLIYRSPPMGSGQENGLIDAQKQHKHIRTAKPKTLNERRRAACLQSVK